MQKIDAFKKVSFSQFEADWKKNFPETENIKNIYDLKELALHEEVLNNIFNDYFKSIYVNKINDIINGDTNLDEKLKSIVECQLKFTLIPISKQKYYREMYKNNYFKESYINKSKEILS